VARRQLKRQFELISLSDELELVADSVEGLGRLLSQQDRSSRQAVGLTALIAGRLRLLRGVVAGRADVSLLRDGHNSREVVESWEDPDVLLPPRRTPR
jgi:hypothetical protein